MSHCPQCPTQTVFDPPIREYVDVYHPQIVQVIHPIEIIRRHHCVPIPHHIYTQTIRDEYCGPSAAISRLRKRKR
jgi:hypothetical protein